MYVCEGGGGGGGGWGEGTPLCGLYGDGVALDRVWFLASLP